MYVSMSAKHCASPIGKQGEGGRLRSRSLHSPHTCMEAGAKRWTDGRTGSNVGAEPSGGKILALSFYPFSFRNVRRISGHGEQFSSLLRVPPLQKLNGAEIRDIFRFYIFLADPVHGAVQYIGERNVITCMHHYALFFLSVFHCKQLGTKTDWPSVL